MKILAEQISNLTGVLDPTSVQHWDAAYDHSLISGDLTIHHEHANKSILDTYTQSNIDITNAILNTHAHNNFTLLENYTVANSDLLTAVSATHIHDNKAILDTYNQSNADIALAITNQHLHLNKTLLDSLTGFTNADILSVIVSNHTHVNKALLDTYTFSDLDVTTSIANSHVHSNLALLETYDQINSDIETAITESHSHINKSILDTIVSNGLGNLFLSDDGTYKEVTVTLEAAGSDTQLMFNDGGVLAGDPDITFNKANNLLTVNTILSSSNLYITDTSTYLSKDGSNNLVFTDIVSGSVTLSTLLSGSVNPWTVNTSYLNYGVAGTNRVGINTTTTPVSALEVVGDITATDFSSSIFRYKSSNLLIGSNAGDNEIGSSKLYIDISSTATPLIYGDFANRVLRFHGDVYIEGTKILNFGSATARIFRGSGDQLSFQDAVANSGNPILLTELIDGTYNVLARDFTDLTAVQSITTGNKATWNKASYLITTGSGDSYLSDDGTYKTVSGSGGSSTTLYLHDETSDISGYEKLLNSPANAVENADTVAVTLGTSPVLIDDYITDPLYPGITVIPAGLWVFKTWLSVSNATGSTSVTIRVYKRTSGGTETELFNVNTGEINSLTPLQYIIETVQPEYAVDATDRLAIKYYVSTSTATSIDTTLYYEGTAHYSYVITPIAFASTTINDYTWKWDATYSYIRPYVDKTEAGGVSSGGRFYSGTSLPTASNRLNYDGNLYTTGINAGSVNTNEIIFNTASYEPSHLEGRLYWSSDYHTLNLMPDISGNILQIGQEIWARCINNTGSTINDGSVVYVTGAVGDKISIALARADSESTSLTTIGITNSEIANGDEGYVTVFGDVHHLNTSSFTAGQLLYLSATVPGGLTTVRPEAPNQVVSLGIVNRSNISTGVIGVQVRVLPTVDRLSDVYISSIEDKQVLGWDSTLSRWENIDKREVQYTGLTYNPANPLLFDNDYQYTPYTLTANITPTYSTTNALPLSYVQLTFIGNGTATVNFSNFIESDGSGVFDITNGVENKVAFYYDGTDYIYCVLKAQQHNNLSSLQGGSTTERYHLTQAQHTISTQAASSTLSGYLTTADWNTFNNKQSALVSGTTIKTINSTSVLGSGDIVTSTDNIFKWDSVNSYYRAYSSKSEPTSSDGKFYLGTDVPTNGTILNYDGRLRAYGLYVPTSSNTYLELYNSGILYANANVARMNLNPMVSDSATSVAYIFDSVYNLTTSGAKTVSIRNNGVEKAFIDKDGNVDIKGEYRINGTAITSGGGVTPTDNILDWNASYYRPYETQQASLSFDTSSTNPTLTTRLNLNGYFYASRLYSGGLQVYGGTASSGTTGALTSTDWSTFNSKKPAQSVNQTYNPANPISFDRDYHYNNYTVSSNITPTYSLTGAVALNSSYITFIGDGSHTVDFINFTKGTGSGAYDVTLGAENKIHFYYDGTTVYYSVLTVLVHNELDLIQGGLPDEKYHMSLSEYNAATRVASAAQSGLLSASDWITFSSNGITITDNILDWDSVNSYYRPYTTQQASVSFDTSEADPTLTTRLNLNGILYVTRLVGVGNSSGTAIYGRSANGTVPAGGFNNTAGGNTLTLSQSGVTTSNTSLLQCNRSESTYGVYSNYIYALDNISAAPAKSGSFIKYEYYPGSGTNKVLLNLQPLAVSSGDAAYRFNTLNTLTTSKLITVLNNDVEKTYITSSGKYTYTAGTSSTFAVAPGVLKDFYTDASTSGTTETDLYSYTIPANVLATNGDKIVFSTTFTTDSTGQIWYRCYFSGTAVGGTNASDYSGVTRNGKITAEVVRTSTTTARVTCTTIMGQFVLVNYNELTGRDWATTHVFKSTGQAVDNGSITARIGSVEYKPAAIN